MNCLGCLDRVNASPRSRPTEIADKHPENVKTQMQIFTFQVLTLVVGGGGGGGLTCQELADSQPANVSKRRACGHWFGIPKNHGRDLISNLHIRWVLPISLQEYRALISSAGFCNFFRVPPISMLSSSFGGGR